MMSPLIFICVFRYVTTVHTIADISKIVVLCLVTTCMKLSLFRLSFRFTKILISLEFSPFNAVYINNHAWFWKFRTFRVTYVRRNWAAEVVASTYSRTSLWLSKTRVIAKCSICLFVMGEQVSETENLRKNLAVERMIVEGCDILLDVNQVFVRQGELLH